MKNIGISQINIFRFSCYAFRRTISHVFGKLALSISAINNEKLLHLGKPVNICITLSCYHEADA